MIFSRQIPTRDGHPFFNKFSRGFSRQIPTIEEHPFFSNHCNEFAQFFKRDVEVDQFEPRTNVYETGTDYEMQMFVPGLTKEDIDISVNKSILNVKFEQKKDSETAQHKIVSKEFVQCSFSRSFSLDEKIDAENISADYQNGVLKITLPVKESASTSATKIELK